MSNSSLRFCGSTIGSGDGKRICAASDPGGNRATLPDGKMASSTHRLSPARSSS